MNNYWVSLKEHHALWRHVDIKTVKNKHLLLYQKKCVSLIIWIKLLESNILEMKHTK